MNSGEKDESCVAILNTYSQVLDALGCVPIYRFCLDHWFY